uniref:Probable calcium-binding protein CML30 n=1 Tax=Tanacetum cinerariifolium TaxID=118510 RepID=A0A6L2NS85_TANCI|nr:probable calcium-binding protein CML30 [Tanacetum cinerariifolium]
METCMYFPHNLTNFSFYIKQRIHHFFIVPYQFIIDTPPTKTYAAATLHEKALATNVRGVENGPEEPSLDEVKQAFGVFDKNNDGYVDAKELQNVLSNMGFLHICESDCRRMIVSYDADKDGKLSFQEFLQVVEDGFR